MGGIMSSSEELMREALMTGMQAPGPADLGPMAMQPQQPMGMPAPPVMQPQQPMMQQPMAPMPMDMGMQQPMAPMPMDMGMQQPMMQQPMMQQPMMQPQQPMMQQPMAEPAFMPPGMPQSAQMPMQPVGFNEGGPIIVGAGTKFPRVVDITQQAGTVVEAPKVSPDALATAEKLAGEVDDRDPEEVGPEIVDAATKDGFEPTGDTKTDLANIYAQLTGDLSAYEKNIDELNRGIIGAAIGAGTSARATENISKGLLVGLEGARATEERRAGDARALLLAEAQARAKGAGGEDSQYLRDTPIGRTFNDVFSGIMDADINTLDIPMIRDEESGEMVPAMSQREYATESGNLAVARTFTPQQLVGTQFEGVHERLQQGGLDVSTGGSAAPAAPAVAGDYTETQRIAIETARLRLQDGTTTPEKVAEVFESFGINLDPATLQ
jgi:hypothetical protein